MIEEQIKLIADALLSDNPTYEEVEKVAESVLAAERVQHPDALDFFARLMKGRCDSKPQRVEKHPIKIPADDHGWYTHGQLGFVSGKPAFESRVQFVLQLFKEL